MFPLPAFLITIQISHSFPKVLFKMLLRRQFHIFDTIFCFDFLEPFLSNFGDIQPVHDVRTTCVNDVKMLKWRRRSTGFWFYFKVKLPSQLPHDVKTDNFINIWIWHANIKISLARKNTQGRANKRIPLLQKAKTVSKATKDFVS